jgi:hypothetical protein
MEPILSEIFDEVPADLEAYFDRIKNGRYAKRRDVELNLLPVHEAVDLTHKFRELLAIVQTLDGFILDNADTSNHHVYLDHPSLKGAVLYLNHDGDTQVVFASLDDCLTAADAAMGSGHDLSGYLPLFCPLAKDQECLGELVRQQLELEDGYGTDVITAIIPSMDLRDLKLLKRLAQDPDFFLGEAVAVEISKRPSAELREVAELCAAHLHFQAAHAGRRAIEELAARGW